MNRANAALRYGSFRPYGAAMSASRIRHWTARLAITLTAWAIAFAVVNALLTLFSEQLNAMSPALRALVISGVLVGLMVNVVMPVVSVRVAQLVQARPHLEIQDLPGESR